MPMHTVIREQRKALGLTQEQVAQTLGVTAPAVNKWEKGTTCPDVALLPPLARLLGIDLNTLFCFHESLTEPEIAGYLNKAAAAFRESGFDAAFQQALDALRTYPNCDLLRYSLTTLLDGTLLMSELSPEEKARYTDQLLAWYERSAQSEDPKVRDPAVYVLARKYLSHQEYERAQALIDQLPERGSLDKRLLQAELLSQQGDAGEAAKQVERQVLSTVTELQTLLLRLTDFELEAGEYPRAAQIADITRRAAETFDLWTYNRPIAPLQVALAERDAHGAIQLLRELLSALFTPWAIHASPLYCRLDVKPNTSSWQLSLPPLLSELEQNEAYAFLRTEPDFQALMEEYRAKLASRTTSPQKPSEDAPR